MEPTAEGWGAGASGQPKYGQPPPHLPLGALLAPSTAPAVCTPPPFALDEAAPLPIVCEGREVLKRQENREEEILQPVGKRLRPVVRLEQGWGPFDADGYRLE